MTNQKVKLSEIAKELQVFAGSIENIVHKHLHMSKVSSRLVPRNVNVNNQHQRVASCQDLLDLYTSDKEKVCCLWVTADETWIHHWD